ncbi:Signal transduction histidine kinase [Modicisalibacter ilicicola DSM 19980]|uniref:histidine kinase n=1 Tax=Modicisalibacter ilicicola DSM 19980 TaxID=1121942 RepID=A0A1M5CW99_9GAMM|nr:sensor histidine kinase [Halomonas ilicicola]SHF59025.1 Signal transduction histidine kinase [Halomonas ilicicola DSM 19980]
MTGAPRLRARLSWFLALSLAAVLALAGMALTFALAQVTETFVVTRMEHDRDTLIASLSAPDTLEQALPRVYRQPYSGHYFQVERNDGEVIRSRSLWDTRLALPSLEAGEQWRSEQAGPQGQPLLVLASGVRAGDAVTIVGVAEDMTELRTTLARVYIALAVLGILTLGALLWLQRRILQGLFAPLMRLQVDTERLIHGELEKLSTQGVPEEVVPLVEAIDRLLGVLSHRLSRSRRALGDLAHSLKTPLTALGTLEGEPELRDSPSLVGRHRAQLERIQRLVDAQLRRARLAGGSAPGRGMALARGVDDLLDTLGRIYRDKQIVVERDVPTDIRVAGDREDVLELLGIVLDNAFKWATSRVAITVGTGETVRIRIEDDGPGVSPAQAGLLTRRGLRLDESAPGSGLGLAIVSDIVEQYEGRLDIVPKGRLGGLAVTVSLPAHSRTILDEDQSSSSSSRRSPRSSK